ncbi:MAG: arylsulfatase [Planctomycetes bacterium]|nr:arylsulfatase [Planctomycetota bacterium]
MRFAIATLLLLPGCAGAPAAPAGRPNVLVLLADDLGFSDIGCYGGEISTPTLDGLAAGGLRFTQFYNTARCWPTRSSLLSGYYAPQIRMDPPKGRLPEWTRLLSHELRPAGYRAYHSGKWHVNGAPKILADGGFDRSYDMTDQDRYFSPKNNHEDDRLLPPVGRDSGYYATTAIADHAIKCLKEHAREHAAAPFFSYVAFISPHFPLHALQQDIDLYRDKFLDGWDAVRERRWKRLKESGIVNCALSARDPNFHPRYFKKEFLDQLGPGEVEAPSAWADLTPEQKRFQATKMAIHAAMVHRMDREIGRVLDQVRSMGALDNTVVLFLSDNGADATILVRGDGHDPKADPGSAASYLCLGPGWASASNAPFRRHKVWVHEGGISTPLIVHWPAGILARGELRRTPGHVVDIVPTILELTGTSALPVKGPPRPGRSLVPALATDATVPHDFIYFHHEGNRALRMGDWKLVSYRENQNAWELYDLGSDRAEMIDLSSRHPERVHEMELRWTELTAEYARHAASP